MTANNNIHITVTGEDKAKKDAVSNIVNNALVHHGFTNVALVNTHGEPMAGTDVPSILDLLAEKEPAFFGTPIKIWADSPVGEAIVAAMAEPTKHYVQGMVEVEDKAVEA